MITIRLLKFKDISFVTESTRQEKWGHLPKDVRRCVELEPKGCFIAQQDGRRVGHVFSISYGAVGWIGLLIVRQSCRGQGIGTALMRAAMNYLRSLGVETIRLEAVPEAIALYQRLGFRSEFNSLRFYKEWKPRETRQKGRVEKIHQIKKVELKELAKFDAECFGASRLKVLRSLYTDFPQHCLIARGATIIGYIMGRKTEMGYWLGPWVCADKHLEVARELIVSFMTALKANLKLKVGVPAPNRSGVQLLEELGFNLTSKSIRMFWGKRGHSGNVKENFAIGGLEKG